MTKPAVVVYFQKPTVAKLCPHDHPLTWVQKFSGGYWESQHCQTCADIAEAQEQAQEEDFEKFLDGIRARLKTT